MYKAPRIDPNVKGYFKFDNGIRLEIDPGLFQSSSVVNEIVTETNKEFEVPVDVEIDQIELEFLNEFTALLREKFTEKFEENAPATCFWVDFIPQNLNEFEQLAQKADKNLLIGGSNAADILNVPSFLSFCTYFLVKRSEGLNLEQLREFLNEDNDFTKEQQQIIANCPELANL